MLDFRMRRSKRHGVRVHVYQKYLRTDVATGKPPYHYRQLGSFLLSQSDDDAKMATLIALLEPDEVFQLYNWLGEAKVAKALGIEADALEKYTFRMPPELHQTFAALHLAAKQVGIDFALHQVMLESAIHAAKQVERKINQIQGSKIGMLEKVGLACDEFVSPPFEKASLDNESKRLFQTLIDLPQPIGKICAELEEAARAYGKTKRIPPAELHDWAGTKSGRNVDKRIKKWAYAVAIDVLHKEGCDVLAIAPPDRVATYWAIQRLEQLNLQAAISLFKQTFKPHDDVLSSVVEAITRVYQDTSYIKPNAE